jgi:hypothetical protein
MCRTSTAERMPAPMEAAGAPIVDPSPARSLTPDGVARDDTFGYGRSSQLHVRRRPPSSPGSIGVSPAPSSGRPVGNLLGSRLADARLVPASWVRSARLLALRHGFAVTNRVTPCSALRTGSLFSVVAPAACGGLSRRPRWRPPIWPSRRIGVALARRSGPTLHSASVNWVGGDMAVTVLECVSVVASAPGGWRHVTELSGASP